VPPRWPSSIRARPDKLFYKLVRAIPAIFFCLGIAGSAFANDKQAQLQELKSRIESLRQEMGQAEATRAEATDQLREAERAISAANRRLRELRRDQANVAAAVNELKRQTQHIGSQITTQQSQLGQLLYRHYVTGQSGALQQLLNGKDPNQLARDLYYLKQVSQAQAELISRLGGSLREKQILAERVEVKNIELAQIEKSSRDERATLLEQQQKRRGVLEQIAQKIKAQRREIDSLKRDETRLARLIEGLGKIISKKPQRPAVKPAEDAQASGPIAEKTLGGEVFSALKGKLRLPVRGQIVSRFGTPRQDGRSAWKGLFIRALAGSEVKTIAAGRVVFADWLRGFGNLIIVDHDDGYLSVYGNNEALFREVGEPVTSGDAIASIGNSGGNPESGLYFELRQDGQAVDPLKWIKLK